MILKFEESGNDLSMHTLEFDGGILVVGRKKIHLILTTLKVVYVLITAKLTEHNVDSVTKTVRTMWEEDDNICKGHIILYETF